MKETDFEWWQFNFSQSTFGNTTFGQEIYHCCDIHCRSSNWFGPSDFYVPKAKHFQKFLFWIAWRQPKQCDESTERTFQKWFPVFLDMSEGKYFESYHTKISDTPSLPLIAVSIQLYTFRSCIAHLYSHLIALPSYFFSLFNLNSAVERNINV